MSDDGGQTTETKGVGRKVKDRGPKIERLQSPSVKGFQDWSGF